MDHSTSKELMRRITHSPGKMAGRPTIRGLRFPVADVLELLASGMSTEHILIQHPLLEREDITAALFYAALVMKGKDY
ncbi:DUF433 domain-containing protein [Chitinophaga cymbidii]|uniref:DUF433 domain-containing protein n=1 Tax=Chitinophaga cymbidii TaxID=1096750 RepID=A0A512RFP3_9BACT|nr:DUF433 domain-containing protein [Chitinophaga cymbidii]GEP94529.1 hypothetical protein CCY01nite_07890 [Chitinophaga cymbidii]